jgi:hypothetical protein
MIVYCDSHVLINVLKVNIALWHITICGHCHPVRSHLFYFCEEPLAFYMSNIFPLGPVFSDTYIYINAFNVSKTMQYKWPTGQGQLWCMYSMLYGGSMCLGTKCSFRCRVHVFCHSLQGFETHGGNNIRISTDQ